MKSFDERKNEIFRRSEELIQKNKLKKKKISRMIYTCVPCFALLLITATFAGEYIPDLKEEEHSNDLSSSFNQSAKFDPNAVEMVDSQLKSDSDMAFAEESKPRTYIRIYYSESDSLKLTDTLVVNSIIDIINNTVKHSDDVVSEYSFPAEYKDVETPDQNIVSPEHTVLNAQPIYITLYNADRTVEKYTFKYPILENCETGKSFTLTKEVGVALYSLIKK